MRGFLPVNFSAADPAAIGFHFQPQRQAAEKTAWMLHRGVEGRILKSWKMPWRGRARGNYIFIVGG